MVAKPRTLILRIDAGFLLLASAGGFTADILGAFFDRGPVAAVISKAPHAAIGLVEAHGLAFIIGVLLWRAEQARCWHLTAVAVHALLGAANIAFWAVFVASDMLTTGYVTTSLHALFAALQLWAAVVPSKPEPSAMHSGS